jgi:hypothetical protein
MKTQDNAIVVNYYRGKSHCANITTTHSDIRMEVDGMSTQIIMPTFEKLDTIVSNL